MWFLGWFEVLSSMNLYSIRYCFLVLNAFCVDKKLFNEFQSGLGYEMLMFLCGFGWYCIVFEWFGVFWGGLVWFGVFQQWAA